MPEWVSTLASNSKKNPELARFPNKLLKTLSHIS
jgi:hypothetical protein